MGKKVLKNEIEIKEKIDKVNEIILDIPEDLDILGI